MTADPGAVPEGADAVVLNRVRAGEAAAYEILRQRHEPALRRLARLLVPPAQVDDVVAEAFAGVREETLAGRGPDDAFRLAVLSAARRVSNGRPRSQQDRHVSRGSGQSEQGEHSEQGEQGELAELSAGIGAGSAGARLIAGAFQSLPERWIAVLWLTEIEGAGLADAAQVFGLTPDEVTELARQAVDGLRQGCLQAYITGAARPECGQLAGQLAAFIRDVAAGRDRAEVMRHLARCEQCRYVCSGLADIRSMLRQVVAPVFLGDAAAPYLLAAREAAKAADTAAVRRSGSGAAPRAASRARHGLGYLLRTPARRRWAAVGTAAVLAGAVILGLSRAGQSTSSARTTGPQAAPAISPAHTRQVSQPPAAQTRKARPGRVAGSPRTRSASASASRSGASPRAASSPDASSPAAGSPPASPPPASPPPAAGAVQLSATVAITNQDPEGNDEGAVEAEVAFSVTDTGSAATGEVDVTLTGAPLWSVVSGSWACQATSSGTTCQDSGIAAGGQAQETLILRTFTETPCNEPVELTAVSGSAQASAQSPQVMAC